MRVSGRSEEVMIKRHTFRFTPLTTEERTFFAFGPEPGIGRTEIPQCTSAVCAIVWAEHRRGWPPLTEGAVAWLLGKAAGATGGAANEKTRPRDEKAQGPNHGFLPGTRCAGLQRHSVCCQFSGTQTHKNKHVLAGSYHRHLSLPHSSSASRLTPTAPFDSRGSLDACAR